MPVVPACGAGRMMPKLAILAGIGVRSIQLPTLISNAIDVVLAEGR